MSKWRDALAPHAAALRIFAAWKTVLTLVLASTPLAFYELPHFNQHARFFTRGIYPLFRPFFQWDGEHYMSIAVSGYMGGDPSSQAFYPGLPMLVRAAAFVVRSPIAAGLLVSTLLTLAFVVVYTRYADTLKPGCGPLAAIVVLCHPMALCLAIVYSEALFLALLAGFLCFRHSERQWIAWGCAFGLPLSRGQGLMVAATFVGFAGLMIIAGRWRGDELRRGVAQSIAFVVGVAALFGIMALATGDPWALFNAQQYFTFNNSIANIFDVEQTWTFLTRRPVLIFDYLNGWLDKIFVFLALALLGLLYRSGDGLRVCLAAALTVVPILMGEGGSFARFSFLPFVLVAPEIAARFKDRLGMAWAILVPCATLQILFSLRFAFNLWVS
ncbi:MAG: hypothetical protein AAF721_14905 [Myxococcota bacterium]